MEKTLDPRVAEHMAALVDEVLSDLEDLKKSDRFSASEVKIEGEDGKIAGHGANGELDAKKAEKPEEKKHEAKKPEHDKDEEEEDMDKAEMHHMMHKFHMKKAEESKHDEKKHKEHMEKAEHHKEKAEDEKSSHKHLEKAEHHMKAAEACEKDEAKKADHEMHLKKYKHHMKKAMECHKAEGVNEQADPDRKAGHKFDKAEGINNSADPDGKAGHKFDKAEKADKKLAKSVDEAEMLMKSYVDEKVSSLDEKLNTVIGMVKEIADAPVPAKGQTYKDKVQPLKKSVESLTKSEVINKLLELKKSGTPVLSTDIASAEMGVTDHNEIAAKYNLI